MKLNSASLENYILLEERNTRLRRIYRGLLIFIFALIPVLVLIFAISMPTADKNNLSPIEKYKVQYLFETNGVKVYSFYHSTAGRYVTFTTKDTVIE